MFQFIGMSLSDGTPRQPMCLYYSVVVSNFSVNSSFASVVFHSVRHAHAAWADLMPVPSMEQTKERNETTAAIIAHFTAWILVLIFFIFVDLHNSTALDKQIDFFLGFYCI